MSGKMNTIAFAAAPFLLVFNALMAVSLLFSGSVSVDGSASIFAKLVVVGFFALQAAFWGVCLFLPSPRKDR